MDVQMPVMDGVEATRRIVAEELGAVLILTTFDRDDYLFDALRAGAGGFLLKNSDPDDVVEGVRTLARGHALLAPEVTTRVIAELHSPAEQKRAAGLELLTARETDVLRLVAKGLSNAEIAAELVVGEATVKTHVSSCLSKLHLRDRVQAVVFAFESGLRD